MPTPTEQRVATARSIASTRPPTGFDRTTIVARRRQAPSLSDLAPVGQRDAFDFRPAKIDADSHD
jgi:hypothetical protein